MAKMLLMELVHNELSILLWLCEIRSEEQQLLNVYDLEVTIHKVILHTVFWKLYLYVTFIAPRTFDTSILET